MNWLKLVATYFPAVLQMVLAVEAQIKDAPGATKKQVVMSVLNPDAGTDGKPPIPADHMTDIGKLIDVTVGALKAVIIAQSEVKL